MCHITKEFLSSHGVSFVEVNVLTDPAALRRVVALGKLPPVVETDSGAASGYNRPALRRLLGL